MTDTDDFYISRLTRSRTGLRVWFSNLRPLGRKFVYTICDGNLLLDEVDKTAGGVSVTLNNHTRSWPLLALGTLYGPNWKEWVHIPPTFANGKCAFIIPGIPELIDRRQKPTYARPEFTRAQPRPAEPVHVEYVTPEPFPWPVEPPNALQRWTVERIKHVLVEVRDIEAFTGYKLTRNDRGQAIFTAPPIEV